MPDIGTAAATVMIGVSVYVIGQVFIKFVIDPIHEQRMHIGLQSSSKPYYVYAASDLAALPTVARDHP